MRKLSFDLNCDTGESFGNYRIPNDQAIIPWVTSVNIACGYHGGDAHHIYKTILTALDHGVRIGAHPGYPDLQGFGRRKMDIPKDELISMLLYQISAVKGMVEALGGRLEYVKPHGALYHDCAHIEKDALAIIIAAKQIDPELAIMGLPNSLVHELCVSNQIAFIREGFADRRYTNEGNLRSRKESDAVLTSKEDVEHQVRTIIKSNRVHTVSNTIIDLTVDSLCIHGDNPNAIEIVRHLHHAFSQEELK